MINIKDYNKYLFYKKKDLFFENFSIEKVAKKYKTPFFCYSVSQIEDNFNILKDSFSVVKPLICYAMKANYNSEIISILSKLGAGVDVVSMGELNKAILNGVDENKIVFSGVGKTKEEIEFAIKKKIKQLNVESKEELEDINLICTKLGCKVNVCLRINPDVSADTHDKISTGRSEDKFGIPNDQVESIFKKYKNHQLIKIIGLSVHIGSQIQSMQPFKNAFTKVKNSVINLNKNGFRIKSLDLGGGIGIKYNKNNKLINLKSYARLIEKLFSDLKVEIIIEPGRFLVGQSGIIVSRIIRIKNEKNKAFLIIDAGMNNLIRPALYNATHNIIPVKLKNIAKVNYDVVGPICETSDSFVKNLKIQKFNNDDLVVICSTGAYGSCMSSKYNLRGEAEELFIKKSKIKVVKS
ncbi:MAG: diaminopimelate decarboxylase [Alphaproteobacteria bacterium]|tara:strand:+ start:844 stop:2070 length:1227 start_codon:yes stop_codon:yes gene_type:complete